MNSSNCSANGKNVTSAANIRAPPKTPPCSQNLKAAPPSPQSNRAILHYAVRITYTIMPDQPRYDLFAVCQPGLEKIVADELRTLGIANPRPGLGGVGVRGFLTHLSRVKLRAPQAQG